MADISNYFGKFIGLTPADESKMAAGEIEIVIDSEGVKFRHATGYGIDEGFIPISELRPLATSELPGQFDPSSNYHTRADGFRVDGGPVLLFLRNPSEGSGFWFWRKPAEFRLIVRFGGFSEAIGPTVLYDEAQVASGNFELLIKMSARVVGRYPIPRLVYGGFHKPSIK